MVVLGTLAHDGDGYEGRSKHSGLKLCLPLCVRKIRFFETVRNKLLIDA